MALPLCHCSSSEAPPHQVVYAARYPRAPVKLPTPARLSVVTHHSADAKTTCTDDVRTHQPRSLWLTYCTSGILLVHQGGLSGRKVAEFIGKKRQKLPFVYRVHDDPDEQKLENLKQIEILRCIDKQLTIVGWPIFPSEILEKLLF